MLKPICVDCKVFYRPRKNGVRFTEAMPARETTSKQPDSWIPYKLWIGDLWACPLCDHEIIVGTGREPAYERHHEEFEEMRKKAGFDWLQVNDC